MPLHRSLSAGTLVSPIYEFQCDRLHTTEKFFHMTDTIPATVDCESCPHLAKRTFGAPAVVDDFPEHVNVSFGQVVKSRKHHRELQKLHGCHDLEHTDSTGSQMVRDRLRR
jgi:hypothetical protein